MELNVAEIIFESRVNGPGVRSVVWVQGCPHNCYGCYNQSFRPFVQAKLLDVEKLANMILTHKNNIDGVTFSGGEPFCQSRGIYSLSLFLKEQGLNIMCYSGYTHRRLINMKNDCIPELLKNIDILIDGPYIRKKRRPLLWRGSENQKIYLFNDKIDINEVKDVSEMEVIINEDGSATITGTFFEDDINPLLENHL